MKTFLLVEPEFPVPTKSKNHCNFLPISLLKLASYYKEKNYKIKLIRGNLLKRNIRLDPDRILVTSLFTYWSKHVKECVQHYKNLYPSVKISVGGIYASLMPKHCKKYTGCDEVFVGINEEAEKYEPDYSLVFDSNNPYQIIHTSRGCFRKCPFCGTWKIEPKVTFKKTIKKEIRSNKLIFYDNNLLRSPYIKDILKEIANTKHNGKAVTCESQCGFDGRLLTPELASLIKKARFIYPRIAWDWKYSEYKDIKKQVDMLIKAGYNRKNIYVFVLYNWDIPFKEMEKKRIKCWQWKIQISDCRYRPIDQTFDDYSPRKKQTNKDYYIHPDWTDEEVKQFRKNIRRQNICIRHDFNFHSRKLENKSFSKKEITKLKFAPKEKVLKNLEDAWFPNRITYPKKFR